MHLKMPAMPIFLFADYGHREFSDEVPDDANAPELLSTFLFCLTDIQLFHSRGLYSDVFANKKSPEKPSLSQGQHQKIQRVILYTNEPITALHGIVNAHATSIC